VHHTKVIKSSVATDSPKQVEEVRDFTDTSSALRQLKKKKAKTRLQGQEHPFL